MNGRGRKEKSATRVRRWNAVIVIALVAITAVPVWTGLRRKAASERLLAPIVRYHRASRDLNKRIALRQLGLLPDRLHFVCMQSQAAAAALCRATSPPPQTWMPQLPGIRRRNAWLDFRSKARGLVESLRSARDLLWSATFRKNRWEYHEHAHDYYQGLRRAWVTSLPPFPADLEAERTSIEDSNRRQLGDPLWNAFGPPPPSRYPPGAPRLRPWDAATPTEETTL